MPDEAGEAGEAGDGPGPLKTHRLLDEGDHLAVVRVLVA